MDLLGTLKNIWKNVINFFKWNKKEEEQTATPTTTTISTQNVNNNNPTDIKQPTWLNAKWTVLVNPTNANTLNETIEKQKQENKNKEVDEITNTPTLQTKY